MNKLSQEESNDVFDEYMINKQPKKGIIGATIGVLPGVFLWVILTFFTPVGGIAGIVISTGLIVGFSLNANYITKKIRTTLLLIGFLLMIILTSLITLYTISYRYTHEILSNENLTDVTTSFITDLNNNGQSTEHNEQFLKDKYNINGFDDKEGFEKLAKETLNEVYMEDHNLSCVPNNPINSIKCFYYFIAYDREIGIPFILNIISGLVFSLLTGSIIFRLERFKRLVIL